MRNKAEKRKNDFKKIKRKKEILKNVFHDLDLWIPNQEYHRLLKGKIHCSCPSCSEKTRNKGKRRYAKGNYHKNLNYKHSDLKKLAVAADWEIS